MTALLTVYCNNINCSIWTYLVIYLYRKERKERERTRYRKDRMEKRKEGGAEVL